MYMAKDQLKIERKSLNSSLREIAAIIGIDYSYLCKIENGKIKIRFDSAAKISKFYGQSIEELFNRT